MYFVSDSRFKLRNVKDHKTFKLIFAFFSIALLLFGSQQYMMTGYSQLDKIPTQAQQQSPQNLQKLQQQEEQQELQFEQQRLQQQKEIAAAEDEEEEGVGGQATENATNVFTFDTDVPSIRDQQKIKVETPNNSTIRGQLLEPMTGNQLTQAQGTVIASSPPPTVLLNPPSTQPVPDTGGPDRGCKTSLWGRVSPQWVTVKPYPYDTVVAEGIITPSKVTVSHHEFPFNHKSHDNNFHVSLDPAYTGLASTAHKLEADGTRVMEMEWEIGTVNTGITDRFPKQFWPFEGDRVWMMGRWVFDCGHFKVDYSNPAHPRYYGYLTEIHPPFATAFTRNEPFKFAGDAKPSSASMTYVYIHGQGGNYNTPVGGKNYEFDIPMPPKPSSLPTTQIKYTIVGLPYGGPSPIITAKLQENKAHVVIPLSSIPASTSLKYGVIVAAKWIDTTKAIPNTEGYRILKVTFDSIKVNKDHDYFSGEWNKLWVGVNGKWIELSGPLGHYGLDDVDDGQLVKFPVGAKSVILTVPEKGQLKIKTTGWEDDNDGYYGKSLASFPPPVGALNDNDKIGFLQALFAADTNFGIGSHSDSSVPAQGDDSDSETNKDFTLNYHIEQLSIIPPTSTSKAKLSSSPTTAPSLK